jgi:hypothetical protein
MEITQATKKTVLSYQDSCDVWWNISIFVKRVAILPV